MSNRGGVPRKKFKPKEDKFTRTAENFVMYMELSDGSINYLKAKKRLTDPLFYRLRIERDLCFNGLLNIFKVSRVWIKGVQDTIHSDPKNFVQAVSDFSDAIAPEKSRLITKNLNREMQNIMASQRQEKQVKTGGNLLVKP